MSLATEFVRILRMRFPDRMVTKLKFTRHWNVRRLQLRKSKSRARSWVAKTIVALPDDRKDERRADRAFATEVSVLRALPSWWGLRFVDAFRDGLHRVIVTEEVSACPWSDYRPSTVANAALVQNLA